MKAIQILWVAVLFLFSFSVTGQNLYDFSVLDIKGEETCLCGLKGKKVMIVNVASKCGLTPQYKELQELYDRYQDREFVILAFPSNDFGGQEPGTNEEIMEFCSLNYGVTFPVMDKVAVKGEDATPLYKWLTQKRENGVEDAPVTWNFQKFLIDRHGNLVKSVSPKTSPLDREILDWIESK